MNGNEQKKYIQGPKYLERTKILNLIIPFLGMIIMSSQMINNILNFRKGSMGVIIFSAILDLMLAHVLLIQHLQMRKDKIIDSYVDCVELKMNSLLEVNDNVRGFKHDFNNIMQAIEGYIMIGDMKSLKVYFSKLLDDCNYIKNLEIIAATNKIKDPALYGVLLNKCKLAEKNNIKMNIDILMDFEGVDKQAYHLARILGILLDNAIEASAECEKKEINIKFREPSEEVKQRSIIIENTYNDKTFDESRIFEKNYSTKKKKGNSGLGLWKVKEIIEKETSMGLLTNKNQKSNVFQQELRLYS